MVCVSDVYEAVNKLQGGKASGPDGLHSESYMYGGWRLYLYISILLYLFIAYGYVPDAFHLATITSVKCKNGELTDVNNYRAIAIQKLNLKITRACFI